LLRRLRRIQTQMRTEISRNLTEKRNLNPLLLLKKKPLKLLSFDLKIRYF